MRMLVAIALMSVLPFTACRIGKSGRDLALAAQPGGAQVVVIARGNRSTGELIAVRQTGVFVSSHGQLRFFHFTLLDQLSVRELGSAYRLSPKAGIPGAQLERIRLVSHFPQGLTPEIERKLLAQMSQSAVDTVR